MASIRELKKDIDYLIFEVISDCFVYTGFHSEKEEKVTDIVNSAVELRNDLIARVNNPEGEGEPKAVRAHFKKIEKDLVEGVDNLFERLSSLSKTKE
jgi:hypothetical protein